MSCLSGPADAARQEARALRENAKLTRQKTADLGSKAKTPASDYPLAADHIRTLPQTASRQERLGALAAYQNRSDVHPYNLYHAYEAYLQAPQLGRNDPEVLAQIEHVAPRSSADRRRCMDEFSLARRQGDISKAIAQLHVARGIGLTPAAKRKHAARDLRLLEQEILKRNPRPRGSELQSGFLREHVTALRVLADALHNGPL